MKKNIILYIVLLIGTISSFAQEQGGAKGDRWTVSFGAGPGFYSRSGVGTVTGLTLYGDYCYRISPTVSAALQLHADLASSGKKEKVVATHFNNHPTIEISLPEHNNRIAISPQILFKPFENGILNRVEAGLGAEFAYQHIYNSEYLDNDYVISYADEVVYNTSAVTTLKRFCLGFCIPVKICCFENETVKISAFGVYRKHFGRKAGSCNYFDGGLLIGIKL